MTRNLGLLILIFVSSVAFSAPTFESRFVKKWAANCETTFGPFQLTFQSVSGDPSNDDMKVSMNFGTERSVVVPLKGALYFSGTLLADSRSQCDNVSTATLPSGNTLILVQRDDRPSENRVSAILLSVNGAVLDTAFDLGAQQGLATLLMESGVVRIKLIHRWQDQSLTSEPSPIPGWLILSDGGGKIKYSWD